jgi:hypothetical protein
MCLRLIKPTTAKSQANRLTLRLLCWEVEMPLMAGAKPMRWLWAFS